MGSVGSDYWWLAIGLFAGLAMTSKYTAAFLWFGIALWLLATPRLRAQLLRPDHGSARCLVVRSFCQSCCGMPNTAGRVSLGKADVWQSGTLPAPSASSAN